MLARKAHDAILADRPHPEQGFRSCLGILRLGKRYDEVRLEAACRRALRARARSYRHGARSTIVTSQLPVETWHDYVADPTIADALLDRIVHVAHRIKLKGPSRRKLET